MANNNLYFYISGFISISLFVFFSSSIVFMMFSQSKIDSYALKKDNYISISLNTPIVQTSSSEISQISPVDDESVIEPKDVDVKDLFNDVQTKKIKKKKKKVVADNNKRLQEIGKKTKKADKKSVKKVMKKSNNNNTNKKSEDAKKTSSGDVVNEYLAKIEALVYDNFIPPPNSEGYSVKAVIDLSAIGKVIDFRILVYSANKSLNNECDKIKNRLLGVLFPLNPQSRSSTTVVNITSDI